MAALLAVLGAMSAVVPATAPATNADSSEACLEVLMLRFC
jgi:hypothetical protein